MAEEKEVEAAKVEGEQAKEAKGGPSALDDLLRRRALLDEHLGEYRKEVGVLLADLGEGKPVESFLAAAQEALEPMKGRVLTARTDMVVAYFTEQKAAAAGALALARAAVEFGKMTGQGEPALLRLGMSWGIGFVKEEDIFGDVFNFATRIHSLAEPGCILVHVALRPVVEAMTEVGVRFLAPSELKGKAAPQEVFEVVWEGTPKGRAVSAVPRAFRSNQFSLLITDSPAAPSSEYRLKEVETALGRTQGEITFPGDDLLSPTHARFIVDDSGLRVQDASETGVYLKLGANPVPLGPGDKLLVGRTRLQFVPGRQAEEASLRPVGKPTPVYVLNLPETVIGRRDGDLVFSGDSMMSGRHARLRYEAGKGFLLEDMRSTNGTYVGVKQSTRLQDGDTLVCGGKLIRVKIKGPGGAGSTPATTTTH